MQKYNFQLNKETTFAFLTKPTYTRYFKNHAKVYLSNIGISGFNAKPV